MKAGRPTIYTKDLVAKALNYADGGWAEAGDAIPSVAGLADELGISRDTCYDWAKDENKEFSYILERIGGRQERRLINGALLGEFNSAVSKMMLTKHGYSDSVKSDHTSSDGTMTPTAIERTIVLPNGAKE